MQWLLTELMYTTRHTINQSIYEMSITVSHTNIFQHFNIDIQQICFGTNAGALFATEIIYEHVLQNVLPLYLIVWHSKLVCLLLSVSHFNASPMGNHHV
jgi:hypothetical protein